MQPVSERARGRGETLGWATVGVGLGFLAGFVLSEVVGGVNSARIRRAVVRLGGAGRRARATAPSGASRVREALASRSELIGLDLQVLRVGRSGIELHGWVPARRLRALAHRVAIDAAHGEVLVTNCILVRGEDDMTGPRELDPADTLETA